MWVRVKSRRVLRGAASGGRETGQITSIDRDANLVRARSCKDHFLELQQVGLNVESKKAGRWEHRRSGTKQKASIIAGAVSGLFGVRCSAQMRMRGFETSAPKAQSDKSCLSHGSRDNDLRRLEPPRVLTLIWRISTGRGLMATGSIQGSRTGRCSMSWHGKEVQRAKRCEGAWG